MEALKEIQPGKYTYADYCTWPDDERWEIIDGVAYSMAPAPSVNHQDVSSELHFEIKSQLRKSGSKCKVYYSPMDVVLDETDIVQPDLFLVCDLSKVGEKNIKGAPDIVFEIRSPSTALKDRTTKLELYQKHGVKTYIIVDPAGYLEVFHLENGKYGVPEVRDRNQTLELEHPKLSIPLDNVFERHESPQPGPSNVAR